MNNSIKKLVAASFIMLGAIQVNAASVVSGTIQVTRDSSRTINGAIIVTEKRDAAGKPIALTLVMDENGKAIAQQYENKQIKIEGNVQGKNLTADTWKEIKDNSFSNSSYEPDPEPSHDDEEESYEEDEENSDEEEDSDTPKKHKKSRKVANPKSDDEDNEDSESDSDSDSDSDSNSDNEDSDSDTDKDSDDNSDNNSDDEESQDEDEE